MVIVISSIICNILLNGSTMGCISHSSSSSSMCTCHPCCYSIWLACLHTSLNCSRHSGQSLFSYHWRLIIIFGFYMNNLIRHTGYIEACCIIYLSCKMMHSKNVIIILFELLSSDFLTQCNISNTMATK